MAEPGKPATLQEIDEACFLLGLAINGPGWSKNDRIALQGSVTALHWAQGGCNCEGRKAFVSMLTRLRAQRDQQASAAREEG